MVSALSSLRGASAEALHDLGGLVESEGRTLEDYAALGADLFEAAALLRAEPGVRRALTDISAPQEAKTGLVHALLDGKLGEAAVALVAEAAGRRWVATRDLADALEHLGVVAVVRAAGARDQQRLSDELFVVHQAVTDDADLRSALSDPARTVADKRGLLRGLLEGKALPSTVALVEQSLAGSFRSVGAALEAYQKVAADVQDEGVALVRSARELTGAEQDRLAAALSAQYGRPIRLNLAVEPDLIGGVRVEIGDDVIEGSIASRLQDARRLIAR
jgi:F-type H+-transporting ATPase subunit delta